MTHKEDNYLMLNGKKVYLTEEQIKTLGLEQLAPKNIFEIEPHSGYVAISVDYSRGFYVNVNDNSMDEIYIYPEQYKGLVKQIAYDRELHDRLLRYSLNHGGDEIDWSNSNDNKYQIYYETITDKFRITNFQYCIDLHSVRFNTEKTAEDAIEEVIKPFLKEHPDYVAYKEGFHL